MVVEHLGRNHRVAEAHHLHAHLLGQRLGQLIVGDQPQADGDLPEHFAGPVLLLLQQASPSGPRGGNPSPPESDRSAESP